MCAYYFVIIKLDLHPGHALGREEEATGPAEISGDLHLRIVTVVCALTVTLTLTLTLMLAMAIAMVIVVIRDVAVLAEAEAEVGVAIVTKDGIIVMMLIDEMIPAEKTEEDG